MRSLCVIPAGRACLAAGFGQTNDGAVKAFVGALIIDGTGKAAI